MNVTIHRAIYKKGEKVAPVEWRIYVCNDGGVVIYPQNTATGKKGGAGSDRTFHHLTSLADCKRAARLCDQRLFERISKHGWRRIG